MRREMGVLAAAAGLYAVALIGLPSWAAYVNHPVVEPPQRAAQLTTRPGVASDTFRDNNRDNAELLRRQSEANRQQFELDQLRQRSETQRLLQQPRATTNCPPGLTC